MRENNWNSQYEPAEERPFYQTGSTRPPKNRTGLVAVILVAVILLGSLISILGFLKFKLFQDRDQEKTTPVSFHQQTDAVPSQEGDAAFPATTDAAVSIELQAVPQTVENVPQAGGLSLQAIYEKNIASVVSITCTTASGSSTGTGLVISQDGYIVTNCHVIEGAGTIELLLHSGEQLPARLVGADAVSDLAVLHVDAQALTAAQFGDSATLRVGDAVVAIGDPLGAQLRGTMTDGIVSAINRDIVVSGRTMTLIQTNAALNTGNSGGPLINCYGQVIGINTMKIGDYMNDAGVEGLGFAIPSATVKDVVDQLISQGFVSGRPSLGFRAETISTFLQMYYRLPQGVYITDIDSGSVKDLAVGDVLLALDGQRITDTDMLSRLLYQYNAGDTVEAIIYRAGTQYTVTLTLDQATS